MNHKELYFSGSRAEIQAFISIMGNMAKHPWSFTMSDESNRMDIIQHISNLKMDYP